MNFKQGDIITRNTGDTPTVWLSQRLVMDVTGISEKQLRTKLRFNYKNSVQKCYQIGRASCRERVYVLV